MFFIKNIFDENIDERVHLQFQKFSRGTFKDRALLKVKCSKRKCSIASTPEYANGLVRAVAEKVGDEKVKVTGVVVSTADLTGKLNFKNKKQFMGVKQYVIDNEMSGNEIKELCDEFPDCFMGLSFKNESVELKIKPKAPKSAKPSTKSEEKPKIDFCRLKTTDMNLVKNLVFEAEDFKEAEIGHDFVIEDIILPEGVSDPAEMRKQAKRKGKIIRKAMIDGKEKESEKEFVA